jgi:hypothetical protein
MKNQRNIQGLTQQPLAGSLPAVILEFRPAGASRLAPKLQSSRVRGEPRTNPKQPSSLTLGELEPLARALLSVLLAFFHTGIARQKSAFPQRRT